MLNSKVRQCDVLYISLEDPEHRIQRRVAEISNDDVENLWLATDAEVIGKGFEDQITNFVVEHPAVKLVIIDTLQRVRQFCPDQYSYASDYDVVSQMKSLADRLGITILLVHHTRKAGATDPFSMISGTTGLSGGVDGSMVLMKDDRMGDTAKLFATGRDIPDTAIELKFDAESCMWQFLGYCVDERVQKRNLLLTEVSNYLQENGPFEGTATELFSQLSARTDLGIKTPNALSGKLNSFKSLLAHEYGIDFSKERISKERTVRLVWIPDDDNKTN